jgi:hypothetical protein
LIRRDTLSRHSGARHKTPARALKLEEKPRRPLYLNWEEYVADPFGVTPVSIGESEDSEEVMPVANQDRMKSSLVDSDPEVTVSSQDSQDAAVEQSLHMLSQASSDRQLLSLKKQLQLTGKGKFRKISWVHPDRLCKLKAIAKDKRDGQKAVKNFARLRMGRIVSRKNFLEARKMYKALRKAYDRQRVGKKELETRVKGLEGELGWKLKELEKLSSRNG